LAKDCRPHVGGVNTLDQIQYREALQRIGINLDVDEPLFKEWIVRDPKNGQEYSSIATSFGARHSDKLVTLNMLNAKWKKEEPLFKPVKTTKVGIIKRQNLNQS
jgi:hypothetical protein